MLDIQKAARTLDESNFKQGQTGYTNKPIFSLFEFDHYVPDELHEFLRICDRLFLNVWQEMEKMDYLNNTYKYREDFLK